MDVAILCISCGFDGRVEVPDDYVDDNFDIGCCIYCPECGELIYDPIERNEDD